MYIQYIYIYIYDADTTELFFFFNFKLRGINKRPWSSVLEHLMPLTYMEMDNEKTSVNLVSFPHKIADVQI